MITIKGAVVMVDGLTHEGRVAAHLLALEIMVLQPDVLLTRIPTHLTVGLTHGDEVYILRRPPLH